jgi:RNA polymerase sigma-70 factor (ECF subfamily)
MKLDPSKAVFAALLEANYARWAGIARAYAAGSDRDDLLQEIMLQVWKGLPGFAGRAHRDTWAYRVALNTALAWDRSAKTRRRRIPTAQDDVAELEAGQATEKIEAKVLDEFLQSLSKVDRALMLVL